jgi:glycopeptide antibiotics resistance protein
MSNGLVSDCIINLFGFIPFGFVFSTLLFRLRSKFPIHFILLAGGAGFLLSLSIEILQAWLPSRDSSAFDLLLNTAGALLGAILFASMVSRKAPEQSAAWHDHFPPGRE